MAWWRGGARWRQVAGWPGGVAVVAWSRAVNLLGNLGSKMEINLLGILGIA